MGTSWLLFFLAPLFLPSSFLSAPHPSLFLRLRGRPAQSCLALLHYGSASWFPTSLRNSWAKQEQQEWAAEMQDFLLDLHDACQERRLLHLTSIPAIECDDWIAHRQAQAKQGQESAGCAGWRVQSKCWLCSTTCGFLYRSLGNPSSYENLHIALL
jgi:hypothetical protein